MLGAVSLELLGAADGKELHEITATDSARLAPATDTGLFVSGGKAEPGVDAQGPATLRGAEDCD